MKLILFDVDGTLVDSLNLIHSAMSEAFRLANLLPPNKSQVRSIIGLKLCLAVSKLGNGDIKEPEISKIATYYRKIFESYRSAGMAEETAQLFPGARDTLDKLRRRPDTILGIVTGKGRQGLQHMLKAHNLHQYFSISRTPDDGPGKPDPQMVFSCLAEMAVEPEDTVVVGDTSFDMQMARYAGVHAIGVDWGYHSQSNLLDNGAQAILSSFCHLPDALRNIWP